MVFTAFKKDVEQLEFPIEDYYRNFIFTPSGEIWVGYRLQSQEYPLNDIDFFRKYIEEGKGILTHDDLSYHFMNIPINKDLENHIDQIIEEKVRGELKDEGTYYFNVAKEILAEEIQMTDYSSYVFIKLTKSVEMVNPIDFFNLFKQRVKDTVRKMTTGDSATDTLLSFYIKKEKQVYSDLLNAKKISRVTETEIERITYYMYHRANIYIPQRQIAKPEMNEGILTDKKGYITVEQLEQTHYIASIPLIDLPASSYGGAIIQDIQDSLYFPIESHVRLSFQHVDKDKKLVRKKRKLIFHQGQDMDNTDAILDDDEVILFGEERLNELNNSLKQRDKRLCRMSIHFVLSATTKEDLDHKIKQLFFVLEGTRYVVYLPLVDQLTLFNQSLIGSDYDFTAYEQVVTTGYFADLGLELNKKIGNNEGMPLGRVVTGKKFLTIEQARDFSSNIVYFLPNLTKRAISGSKHTNGNTLITGPPGSGKSVLVKLIFFWLSFFGQLILYIDPKNEMEGFCRQAIEKYGDKIPAFKSLIEKINFISLSDDEKYQGVLDPLVFLKKEDAIQTTRAVCETLGEVHTNSNTMMAKKNVIIKAINQVFVETDKPTMLKLVKIIEKADEELAQIILSANTGVGKVLFGTETSQSINLKSQINVLGIQGLDLPTKKERVDKETVLTPDQIAGTAIWQVMLKFIQLFATDKSVDSALFIDEAKGIEDVPQGEKMIEDAMRKGRANMTDVYFLTQAFADANDEAKKELISYKFAFTPKEKEARKDVLDFFGMPVNKRNLELFDSLIQGTCIFQDHLGRNQAIMVDVMFEEWLLAISSTKKDDPDVLRALAREQEQGV